jgi:hypothetical protein
MNCSNELRAVAESPSQAPCSDRSEQLAPAPVADLRSQVPEK